MPSAKTKRIAPEIDAKLWDELVAVAKRNGQSQRYVLEQALAHYLHNVVPSQHLVRPQVMDALSSRSTAIAICWNASPSKWRTI